MPPGVKILLRQSMGGGGFFCALAVSLSHCLALLLSFQYS
jgi:hypothetical protein